MENSDNSHQLKKSSTTAQVNCQDPPFGPNASLTTIPEMPNSHSQHDINVNTDFMSLYLARAIPSHQIATASIPRSTLPVVGTPLAVGAI